MYTIHTTPGFIIGSRPYGEAGKMLQIFTRDLGLVMVAAQGIRLEKSKLRYHTSDYSFGRFSLVRGKEIWRLTSAAEVFSMKYEVGGDKESVIPAPDIRRGQAPAGICAQELDSLPHTPHATLLVRMSVLLKRLLQGEDPHPELFDCLVSTLETSRTIPVERLPELESLVALRILNLLGYIGNSDTIRPFVNTEPVSVELLSALSPLRLQVNGIINASLQASQL